MRCDVFTRSAFIVLVSVSTLATLPGCGEPSPGVIYASISVRCGNDIYDLSTGDNGGKCTTTEGPAGTGATCTGGGGSSGASMTCKDGVGKCLESEGRGSCSIRAD